MQEDVREYIGKTLDGVGCVTGYNEKNKTFSVNITYCDHIHIGKKEFLTMFKQQEIKKEVDWILRMYELEVPTKKPKQTNYYSEAIVNGIIVSWLIVLTILLLCK